jgi:hypothetical protein
MAWMPDGSFYVADGYNGTRVAKFDKDGKFLLAFGERGSGSGDEGEESRPGYMNNVHGVAVDVETRRVFVNDRANHRIQIFDENGKYLSEWKIAVRPSSLHLIQIGQDRTLVTFDRNTHKVCCTRGGRLVIFLERYGACTASARIRKETSTLPKSMRAGSRSSCRGRGPTRRIWSASRFTPRGNRSSPVGRW